MATKVEEAKQEIRELIANLEAIEKDPFIGRRQMFEKLKSERNRITRLVQTVGSF